jgi:nicotinamide-nucleotide amidase
MRIEIVTIGNELLSGRTLDTNFALLARLCEEANVAVAWHATVGDDAGRIAEALTTALARADAVVMTGGLGPTPDDVTRAAVAGVLGRTLELDKQVLERIRERARRSGRRPPASIESQALVPSGARILENRLGTAPGLLLEHDGRPVVLLPGVPHEMEALAREQVVPELGARSGVRVVSFTLRTAGVFESQLHEAIDELPGRWPGATLAYLPGLPGVDLRVTVAAAEAAVAEAVAARARAELLERVAPVVYAEGVRGMEEVVGEELLARGWRIAAAESCTGGLLAKRLTDAAGSSRWFERGFVAYSNESKVELLGVRREDLAAHGAVSAPVAEQMAAGAAERSAVAVGVGITGIAGPGGGTAEKPVGTVWIAARTPDGAASRALALAGTRATIRERAAQAALDLVRRRLQGRPVEPKLPGRG